MSISKKLFLCFVLLALVFSLAPINQAKAENFVFNNNLRFGTINQEVKSLQEFLNTTNCPIASSGVGSVGHETNYFGFKTKDAVICFQKLKNLTSDGIIGPITRATLNSTMVSLASTTLPAGCSKGNLYSATTGLSCTTGLPAVPFHVASGGSGNGGSVNHSDATLRASSKIKGETLLALGTPDDALPGALVPGFVLLTQTEADDVSNAGNFITSFVPTNSSATTKIVKYNFPLGPGPGNSPSTFETDTAYNGTDAISNGGIFVIKVSQGSSTLYYVIITLIQAESTATAVDTSFTITDTLTAGTFDAIGGIDVANWTISGADTVDLNPIVSVVLSAGDTVATITTTGAIQAGHEYKITPSQAAFSDGFVMTSPETTVTVGAPTEITSFDAILDVDGGAAGAGAIYADAAAVIAALPLTATASPGAVVVPVTTWVDTDTYDVNTAGSYTFTATLGAIPPGYANTGGFTATVEVVLSPSITSSTYDAVTGNLVLTGTGFDTGSTIDVTKLTITGKGPTYDLTAATANPTPASDTTATVVIAGADKIAVDAILDTNGTQSSDTITYNVAAATGWQTILLVDNLADATTPITVSNASVAVVSSATTIDEHTIRITFNKPLTDGTHASANGFTVGGTLSNAPVTITDVALGLGGPTSPIVNLTTDNHLVNGDDITVSYNSATATVKLTGTNGDVVSFGPYGVTNTL